ncbi:MAG TPA: TetR/AcrR family transcriptional regulator [Solirubrobacterales bacterium]|nr:TetR/AcrR family transcriptional regulator [Solirubrobacterales bacterium]
MLRDQRERLIAAVPGVVAKHGYEAMSVADIVKAAAVSRNAFYKNFSDKQECFATAHEVGHERLFEILTQPCEAGATIEERVELSLAAGLDALAADPDVARLLFVEAPSAGEEIALRYHEWLGRYGTLLRSAAPEMPREAQPAPEVEGVIVGGVASRIASEVLNGKAAKLRDLSAPLVEYLLAFFRLSEPGPKEGKLVPFESESRQAQESVEAQRKQASA